MGTDSEGGADGFARVEAVLRNSSSRSTLYQWMRRHHGPLLERMSELRPNWAALAREFGAMGLRDGAGKAASPEVARRTWWQVRRDVAAAEARKRRLPVATPSPVAERAARGARPMATAGAAPAVPFDPEEDAGASVDFRPARLRGRTPGPASDET